MAARSQPNTVPDFEIVESSPSMYISSSSNIYASDSGSTSTHIHDHSYFSATNIQDEEVSRGSGNVNVTNDAGELESLVPDGADSVDRSADLMQNQAENHSVSQNHVLLIVNTH